MIHVENAKANAVVCQIPANGHFYCREAVIGQNIGAGDNWENVDSCRESANGGDLHEW
jgi:hypothetical protein